MTSKSFPPLSQIPFLSNTVHGYGISLLPRSTQGLEPTVFCPDFFDFLFSAQFLPLSISDLGKKKQNKTKNMLPDEKSKINK